MKWTSVRKEVFGTIMKTDITCEVLCAESERSAAIIYVEEAFEMFRDFESRYSRFIPNNDLWQLNMSEKQTVSEELFEILEAAKRYYEITNGLFDPSILPVMEKSGYIGAYEAHIFEKGQCFSRLMLDKSTRTVTKPKELMIDLGGIGKGFIVDKVVRFLESRFANVLVDAGGDIAVRGKNEKEGYPYWAIDIEHPQRQDDSVALLLLKDVAVATSGRNRRHWTHQGIHKHHIINPMTQESASSNLLSVSVVATSATEADVFAKTLFIAGKKRGMKMAEDMNLPTVFVDKMGLVTRNHYIEAYAWKP